VKKNKKRAPHPIHIVHLGAWAWLVLVVLLTLVIGNRYVPHTSAEGTFITRSGSQLLYNVKHFTIAGTNAYNIATDWAINVGCGSQLSDQELSDLFHGMKSNGFVRFWAFQDFVINKNTQARDWTPLDRVFASAESNNVKLIPVIADNWGSCEPAKDVNWYGGGYMQAQQPGAAGERYGVVLQRQSYYNYTTELVSRYKNSPSVGFWELVNEAEGAWDGAHGYCVGQTELHSFFDTMAKRIKSLDPNHLTSAGVIGGNQCGLTGTDWFTVFDGSAVDILTSNNFQGDWVDSLGPTLALRLPQAKQMNKPLYVKEAATGFGSGTYWDGGGACPYAGINERKSAAEGKLNAAFAGGAVGFMWWNYATAPAGGCDSGLTLNDPLMTLLTTYQLPSPPASGSSSSPILGSQPSSSIQPGRGVPLEVVRNPQVPSARDPQNLPPPTNQSSNVNHDGVLAAFNKGPAKQAVPIQTLRFAKLHIGLMFVSLAAAQLTLIGSWAIIYRHYTHTFAWARALANIAIRLFG
jgi:mannan endo-1,4-beta-mannosidase